MGTRILFFCSLVTFFYDTKAATFVDIGKIAEKNKYFPERIIKTLKPIGFQQCRKNCDKNGNCLSINYSKEHLTCELLSEAAGSEADLSVRIGYIYAVKKQPNVCKEMGCNRTSNCLRTRVGNPVCLKNLPCPRDCQDIEVAEVQANSVQSICPFDDGVSIEVQCETNGTHIWTVIQRRFDGSEDFYRTWTEYKLGFGTASGEYWIGNDYIYVLTSLGTYQLFIEAEDWNLERAFGKFNHFSVGNESSDYVLLASGYSGNFDDDVQFNNGFGFSTKDRSVSNPKSNLTCAELHRSGWWHSTRYLLTGCTYINPNGEYTNQTVESHKVIYWDYFKKMKSLKSFVMKIQHN